MIFNTKYFVKFQSCDDQKTAYLNTLKLAIVTSLYKLLIKPLQHFKYHKAILINPSFQVTLTEGESTIQLTPLY
jgi:hypothetical protein